MGGFVTEERVIWIKCKNSWDMCSVVCGFGEVKNVPLILG